MLRCCPFFAPPSGLPIYSSIRGKQEDVVDCKSKEIKTGQEGALRKSFKAPTSISRQTNLLELRTSHNYEKITEIPYINSFVRLSMFLTWSFAILKANILWLKFGKLLYFRIFSQNFRKLDGNFFRAHKTEFPIFFIK